MFSFGLITNRLTADVTEHGMAFDNLIHRLRISAGGLSEADRPYYDLVAAEMQKGVRDDGLWLMAYERALGDETRAKAHYISLRVQSLKDAMASSASDRERDAVRDEVGPDSYDSSTSEKIAQNYETPDAPADFAYPIVAFVLSVLAIIMVLSIISIKPE